MTIQPCSSSSVNPPLSSASQSELDAVVDTLLHSPEINQFISNQLCLLPPGVLRKLRARELSQTEKCETLSMNSICQGMTIDQALKILPTIHKISILFQLAHPQIIFEHQGLYNASRRICPNLLVVSREVLLEDLSAYQATIRKWTDGVISSAPLNAYRVMRMLAIAAIDHCSKNKEIQKFKMSSYDPKKRQTVNHPVNDYLNSLRDLLIDFFYRLDLTFLPPDSFPTLNSDSVMAEMNAIVEQLGGISDDTNIEILKDTLYLLQKGLEYPFIFFPLLLQPIQTLPLISSDSFSLDERIENWIDDFFIALVTQFEKFDTYCVELTKHHLRNNQMGRSLKRTIQNFHQQHKIQCDALLKAARRVQSAVLKALNLLAEYERLSADYQHIDSRKQLDKIELQSNDSIVNLTELQAEYNKIRNVFSAFFSGLKEFKENKIQDNFIPLFDSYVQYPFHYYLNLLLSTVATIQNIKNLYSLFHQFIETLLPEQFKSLGQVTLIDLILMNLELNYRQQVEKIEVKEEKIFVMKCHERLSQGLALMKKYYVVTHYEARRSRCEHFDHAQCAALFKTVQVDLEQSPQIDSPLLKLYFETANLLEDAVHSNRWPILFLRNPFAPKEASVESQLLLEKKFYHAYQMQVESVVLEFSLEEIKTCFDTIIFFLKNAKIELPLVEDHCQDILRLLKEIRETIPKLQEMKLEIFEAEAEGFWDTAVEMALKFEALSETLMIRFHEDQARNAPSCTQFGELIGSLHAIMDQFENQVYIPGIAIKRFLKVTELMKESNVKDRDLRKVAPRRSAFRPRSVCWDVVPSAPTPAALPSVRQPVVPKTLESAFESFQQIVGQLPHLYRDFTPATATSDYHRLNKLQHEGVENLQGSLVGLRELFSCIDQDGHHPFFIHALHLKLAVAIEQAGKLVSANLNVFHEPDDAEHALLKRMGRECFWQQHNPFNFASLVEKSHRNTHNALLFDRDERPFMQQLSRVIDVTSRYPASGQDSLMLSLRGAFSNPNDTAPSQRMREQFQMALRILLKICKPDASNVQPLEPVQGFTKVELQECLSLTKKGLPTPWREKAQRVTQTLRDRIIQQKQNLAFPADRWVPAIDGADRSFEKRKGTIWGCLHDMEIGLDLCEQVLSFKEDPALCLILAEEVLLHQTTILEEAQLILLSYLPCRASEKSSHHYLWQEDGNKCLRYQHSIGKHAERLPEFLQQQGIVRPAEFYEKLKNLSSARVQYLQSSYRYYHHQERPCAITMLRDTIKNLSTLRDKVIQNQLTHFEQSEIDQRFGIKDPSERLSKLDAYIQEALIERIKLPALEVLLVAEELLSIYEDVREKYNTR